MKTDATATFRPGCYHRNRKGIYLIKQADGNRLLCEYMDGISFEGNANLLHNIEFKILGYNLPSPLVANDLLRKSGVDLTRLQPFEIIENAGRLIKESLDEEDRLAIQAIYERQMKLFGAPTTDIRKATIHGRESGCHKCKNKPLLSDILYECAICRGMVCRTCGSCLCNYVRPSSGIEVQF